MTNSYMWRRVHRIYRAVDVIAVKTKKKDKLRNENYLLSNANDLGHRPCECIATTEA